MREKFLVRGGVEWENRAADGMDGGREVRRGRGGR